MWAFQGPFEIWPLDGGGLHSAVAYKHILKVAPPAHVIKLRGSQTSDITIVWTVPSHPPKIALKLTLLPRRTAT